MADHLLPASASPLMLALSRAMDPYPRLGQDMLEMRGLKLRTPGELLPWLLWEYGVGDIARFVQDPEQVLEQGISWQRVRGTEAGLRQALAWLGMAHPVIREGLLSWPTVEIDPGFIPTPGQCHDLLYLAHRSLPARAHVTRVYHGLDLHPFHLNRERFGQGLLSALSGVWDARDGVLYSFGQRRQALITADYPAAFRSGSATTLIRGRQSRDLTRVLDGGMVFGQRPLPNRLFSRGVTQGRWTGGLDVHTARTPRYLARAALVLSGDNRLGEANATLPAYRRVEEGGAMPLNLTRLGEQAWHFRRVPVLERTIDRAGRGTVGNLSSLCTTARRQERGVVLPYPDRPLLGASTVWGETALANLPFSRTIIIDGGAGYENVSWPETSWPDTAWNDLDVIIGTRHSSES